VLFVVGPLLSLVSDSVVLLMAGRFVVGLGVGLASVVAPVLIAEMAQEHNRGKLTTMHQLFVTVGILFSGLVGFMYVQRSVQVWSVAHAVRRLCMTASSSTSRGDGWGCSDLGCSLRLYKSPCKAASLRVRNG